MADGAGQPNEYLALKVGQDFVDAARQAEKNWLYTSQERGIWRLWWLIYCQVQGIDPQTGSYNSTQELKFVGKNANYAMFRVQLARRFIQQRMMLAKDQRPSFTGVATTNNSVAMAEVNIATRAIEYQLTEARMESESSRALEYMCYFGASALLAEWDDWGGMLVDAMEPARDQQGQEILEDGQPVPIKVKRKSGAAKSRALYPWQFACDPYMESDHPWIITKTAVNKYELAAHVAGDNEELYQQIVALSLDEEMCDDALFAWGRRGSVSSDTIILRQYFHRDCKAVPGGRWAGYVGKLGLWGVNPDESGQFTPCPIETGIPVRVMVGPRYFGTAYGYPESGDLLALQQVINEVISMCVTNIQKRGNPNAYKSANDTIDEGAFSMGGKLFEITRMEDKPVFDEPPKMDTLSQYILEFCLGQARQMLGGNSVVEGNPDANITSGAFAVLMVNLAQKYASQTQEAYDQALVGHANDMLELTKKNARDGFWADIAGLGDAPYLELITQSQVNQLRSVKLVRQSPIMSTFVGRSEVFDRTIQLNKRDRADALDMLLNGRIEAFAQRDQSSRNRIRKENEMMLQGVMPVVAFCDDHALEGPEHKVEYDKLRTMDPPADAPQTPPPPLGPNDPNWRAWLATGGPEFMAWSLACKAFDDHMLQHAMALATTPPPMAIVAGWAPLMPAGPEGEGEEGQSEGASPGGPRGASSSMPKPPSAPKPPKPPAGAGKVSEAA